MNDLKFAFRQLLKNPGFTAVAVLTLALGIGANTAIFSFVNAVLLRPLPYRAPDELVNVWESEAGRGIPQSTVSYADFTDWREQAKGFAGIAAFTGTTFTLSSGAEPEQALGLQVSDNYFDVLGVGAKLGRGFAKEDIEFGKHQVVVLSAATWQRLFNGAEDVIGKTLLLNRQLWTVIGVMPASLSAVNQRVAFWVPLAVFCGCVPSIRVSARTAS